jgi:putative FmdB family regulatory protein
MPTYDYRCNVCQTQFEANHRLSTPAPVCHRCGGETRRVYLSAPAVHGAMARGRDIAAKSLPQCGKGCRCCP